MTGARLVEVGGEVGGRWSLEFRRWSCLSENSTTKAVASSLLGVRGSPSAGDQVPSSGGHQA